MDDKDTLRAYKLFLLLQTLQTQESGYEFKGKIDYWSVCDHIIILADFHSSEGSAVVFGDMQSEEMSKEPLDSDKVKL